MTFIEAWFYLLVLATLFGLLTVDQALTALLAGFVARVGYVTAALLWCRLRGRPLPPL